MATTMGQKVLRGVAAAIMIGIYSLGAVGVTGLTMGATATQAEARGWRGRGWRGRGWRGRGWRGRGWRGRGWRGRGWRGRGRGWYGGRGWRGRGGPGIYLYF